MRRVVNNLLPIIIVAHIVNALLYLSIPAETKNQVDHKDLYALWFFGSEFLIFSPAILIIVIHKTLSDQDKYFLKCEAGHLIIRGIVYVLHYACILDTDSRQRLSFLLGYVFLVSLQYIYKNLKVIRSG